MLEMITFGNDDHVIPLVQPEMLTESMAAAITANLNMFFTLLLMDFLTIGNPGMTMRTNLTAGKTIPNPGEAMG